MKFILLNSNPVLCRDVDFITNSNDKLFFAQKARYLYNKLCTLSTLQGIIHASELYYLFGTPLFYSEPCAGDPSITCPQIWTSYQQWDKLDTEISKHMIQLWSSFAKIK